MNFHVFSPSGFYISSQPTMQHARNFAAARAEKYRQSYSIREGKYILGEGMERKKDAAQSF